MNTKSVKRGARLDAGVSSYRISGIEYSIWYPIWYLVSDLWYLISGKRDFLSVTVLEGSTVGSRGQFVSDFYQILSDF